MRLLPGSGDWEQGCCMGAETENEVAAWEWRLGTRLLHGSGD